VKFVSTLSRYENLPKILSHRTKWPGLAVRSWVSSAVGGTRSLGHGNRTNEYSQIGRATILSRPAAGTIGESQHCHSRSLQHREVQEMSTGSSTRAAACPRIIPRTWRNGNLGPAVFKAPPEWIAKIVPANRNLSCWDSDIIQLGNRYLLYYTVSSFGENNLSIGLALIHSRPKRSGVTIGRTKGSWCGLKRETSQWRLIRHLPRQRRQPVADLWFVLERHQLLQLDRKTGKRLSPDSKLFSLAHNESIEASYLCPA
jgi:hypothetical protein